MLSWRQYKNFSCIDSGPTIFTPQKTTVWSFPNRGSWASHTPQYRGNWSPWVVRNLLALYSKPGDIVLDPMVGGGTTPVECKLMGRNSISRDINPAAIRITKDRLNLPDECLIGIPPTNHDVQVGDTRQIDLTDDSVDLILSHPPYADIIHYSSDIAGDLSLIDDYTSFFKEFRKAISEYIRVLKPEHYFALLIGDTHHCGYYVPISDKLMVDSLRTGFVLKEEIIKIEWNCMTDISNKSYVSSFLRTAHERLFVFQKKQSSFSKKSNESNIIDS